MLTLLLAVAFAAEVETAAPQVALETSEGTIVIELFEEAAPETVANFLRYVDGGFYADTIFHRVIPGFMIQGGGLTAELDKKPTREAIDNEADNGLKNERGTIAMARTSDPHSATAQFFINVDDNEALDHTAPTPRGWGYTVFGRVVEGMEVVDAIVAAPTEPRAGHQNVPVESIVIESATRVSDDSSESGETSESDDDA